MYNIDNIIVSGKKGGSAPKPYVPKEDENTLQANTIANLVDLICEGEIYGPANDDDWYKSTYLNEIPVMDDLGGYNYDGITIEARTGTSSQDYLKGFLSTETETSVNVEVTEAGGAVSRTITNSDVDDAKVTISLPYLLEQSDKGDLLKTTVEFDITITPDNGAGSELTVVSGTIYGKCTSEYRKQYRIENLSQYGSAPWVIKLYRKTEDSGSAKLNNSLYWYSYTEVVDTKLKYMDRAVIGISLDAQKFGDQIPTRAYKVKGRKVKIPSNYNASTRTYTGDWNGVFTTDYTNNPAWVVYDILTDKNAGLGDTISEDMVDKWELYSVAQWCDEDIAYTTVEIQEDGTYSTTSGIEPRFTFNGVIEDREKALLVLQHLCSVFQGFPIWNTGQISFVQDRTGSVTRVASPSNVSPAGFQYAGTARRKHHTVAKVSWNNPDRFGELDTLEYVDEDNIRMFGYNPTDISLFGCTSRSEALRRAKYILDTDINTGEIVTFKGDLEWADARPGEIIAIQDPDYSGTVLEGRVVSSTTTSITLSRSITIEPGETYTLLVQQATTTPVQKTLTNSPGTTNVLTWSGAITAPPADAVAVISSTNLSNRLFRILNIAEVEDGYEISAIIYDPDKYDRIENGIVVEKPATISIPTGKLTAPTNITAEPFSYTEGDSDNRKYGIQIGWEHSTDSRTDDYELRYKVSNGAWEGLGTTVQPSYTWRNVAAGTYDISVRGRGITGKSDWLTYTDFTLITTVSGLAAPTGLDTIDGGGSWSGPDCGITWTTSSGHLYEDDLIGDSNIKNYKIEVRKADTTLLRTVFTKGKYDNEFYYTYEMNGDDNNGSPLRNLLFYVYTVDIYDTVSATYASVAASNPAPDMSSSTPTVTAKAGFLKVEWTAVSDNDMSYYKIYCDENNPPTTHVASITHPATLYEEQDVSYGTDYYVQIEPYDGFGAGTKSQIPSAESPLIIPGTDVDAEVSDIYQITDSDLNSAATLEALKDNVFSSGGVAYSVSGTDKYIQYYTGLNNYWDRWVIAASNGNARVYVAVSEDGSSWTYYKNSGGDFVVATNQADAQSNYLSLSAGTNYPLMPNNVYGHYIRLYLTGSWSTTLYEAVPSNIGIFKLAAIESLSTISINAGSIRAGNLQSTDYDATHGMNIDLDSKVIYLGGSSSPVFSYDNATKTLNCTGSFVFNSGSSGYSNITDAPSDLSELDATANTKLSGIEAGADVTGSHTAADTTLVNGTSAATVKNNAANGATAYSKVTSWVAAEDTTKIDGGNLYVGSSIFLDEGGVLICGDQNVIVDTNGSHGSIVVAEDGGPTTGDYCSLSDGDINFYYYKSGQHYQYKTMKRVEVGTADNNQFVNIPGIFKARPNIIVSPNNLQSYNKDYANQSQSLRYEVTELTEYSTGQWKFRAKATLELSDGTAAGNINELQEKNTPGIAQWTSWEGARYPLPANTRHIWVTINGSGVSYDSWSYTTHSTKEQPGVTIWQYNQYNEKFYLRLNLYYSGGWHYVYSPLIDGSTEGNLVIDSGFLAADITQFSVSLIHNTHYSAGGGSGSRGDITTQKFTVIGYSGDLTSAAVVAAGTLNWMAIGY